MARRSPRIASVIGKPDTRGLPQGFDPRQFYEYSSQKRQQSATGLEGLLYKLMPYNLIKSLAFAIDPLSQFKVSATKIAPVSRTRTKVFSNVQQPRGYTWTQFNRINPYKYLPGGYTDDKGPSYTIRTAQASINHVSEDVTASDRPEGTDMGEFSKWKAYANSSPRSLHNFTSQERWYDDYPSGYLYKYLSSTHYAGDGPAAYITKSTVDAIKGQVQDQAFAVMQDKVLSMFQSCSSQKRATTLFRNIVELKDLPRGILQLQSTLKDLRVLSDTLKIPKATLEKIHSIKTVALDIPKEFLSYSFGWRQTYSDISDLLLAPERISKRVNFLIRRNGKATTYRHQRTVAGGDMTTSGFNYEQYPPETVIGINSSINVEHVLKMVINTTFEFPDVDTPKFRNSEYYRQLGVVPTPIDLYNLVPWTWLFDWFTGFGKYLEVIEAINTDKNLINWGLLTCVSKGEVRTTFAAKSQNSSSSGTDPTVFTYPVTSHSSSLSFESQLRRDVSGMLNVNAVAETGSLTTFQHAILGSLLIGKLKL